MPKLHDEAGFRGYCAAIGKGNSYQAACARTCLQCRGATVAQMRRAIEDDVSSGKIDGASYRTRIEAVDVLEDMFKRGVQTHRVDTADRKQWRTIGEHCHMRIDHVERIR